MARATPRSSTTRAASRSRATGDAYIADSANQVVRKVTAAGVVTTVAGTFGRVGVTDGTPGDPLSASFNDPSGVAVDGAGTVYVADAGNSRIRKVAAGTVTTIVNGGPLARPRGLAINAAGTVLYVASVGNHRILRVDLATNAVSVVAGNGTQGGAVGTRLAAQFNGASGSPSTSRTTGCTWPIPATTTCAS